MLSGGGKIALSSSGNNFFSVGTTVTLTNVNNNIFGAGGIGVGGDTSLTLVNSGTINANVNTTSGLLVIDLLNPVSNAGVLEATNSGGLYLLGTTISNTSAGRVDASGAKAQVVLSGSTIIGGTLKTSGASAAIITDKNSINDGISGATIASGSLVAAAGVNETLTLSGGAIGVGATVETLSGGHIIVTGAVTNSGALFANGGGSSLLDIAIGAVVTGGGIIKIGNGAAQIEGSGSENVTFVASASGGLLIDDAFLTPTAYSGNITSFGGVTHTNHSQFIDLVQVTSDSTVSAFYTSVTANSGMLTVTSGLVPVTVAQINFIGHYATSNFQISSGFGGTVMIVDPTVPNGGSVTPANSATLPRQGIDLPNIAWAQTTLAYTANATGAGGTLTVSDGRHAARIALLGNYMAGSFATAADGHGGTPISEAQAQSQLLLTNPRHGLPVGRFGDPLGSTARTPNGRNPIHVWH